MRPTVRKVSQFLGAHPHIFVNDPAYQLATLRHAPEMSEVIWEIKRALDKGIAPEPCEHATSNSVFLKGEDGKPLAIFKQEDYLHEYAVYRLDHKGFAGVPPTVLTTLSHPLLGGEVTGSCQLYVENSQTAVELSHQEFEHFDPTPIRRIAQLDIRILNADRHTSNLLIRDKTEVIPIDHGFSLPCVLERINFVWVLWEQAETPFSEEEQGYISALDPEKDRAFVMEELGLQEEVANRLYLSTMLLKLGVIHHFLPEQIGDMISKTLYRDAPQSKFEVLIERLKERNARDWTTFTRFVHDEIKIVLEEYETNQHKYRSIFS